MQTNIKHKDLATLETILAFEFITKPVFQDIQYGRNMALNIQNVPNNIYSIITPRETEGYRFGLVRPSVRLSVRLSVRPSVSP